MTGKWARPMSAGTTLEDIRICVLCIGDFMYTKMWKEFLGALVFIAPLRKLNTDHQKSHDCKTLKAWIRIIYNKKYVGFWAFLKLLVLLAWSFQFIFTLVLKLDVS